MQATAAHNSGGIVIAQVKRVVEAGTLHPLMVEVPGILVDHVVVHADAHQWEYGAAEPDTPASTGARRMPLPPAPTIPLGALKVIGRRALMEVATVTSSTPAVACRCRRCSRSSEEEGVAADFRWSVEHGVFGGRPLSSTHWNPTAITSPGWLLDFYDGGGLSQSFLAFGEVDRYGNVNVGRLGDQLPGPGGFTDIASSTRKVTYIGTMTSGGLEVEVGDGRLRIVREGTCDEVRRRRARWCAPAVPGAANGQEITFVTERAVFRQVDGGLVLTEVAPGIDVQHRGARPRPVPDRRRADLKPMDGRLFRDEPMGLELATPISGGDVASLDAGVADLWARLKDASRRRAGCRFLTSKVFHRATFLLDHAPVCGRGRPHVRDWAFFARQRA